ncbi:unnamed protein product [Plutella xylostella]|uniref:(diamondback moth) hypothetical protein n=1 Tax=Plutella xylostella TaxID=51655 RepID=A0A8S4G6W9_PLUXY|nr:unnamed protein product [Plutella xylostella]
MPKKPLQKARENRSSDKKDLTFHPYHITPETAHTAVLLLESEEDEILCQTLRAITKFSAQDTRNREILFQLDAIKYILPHIQHKALNVQRFALKALAQLCQLPTAPEIVLADAENVRTVAALLGKATNCRRTCLGTCRLRVAATSRSVLRRRSRLYSDIYVSQNRFRVLARETELPAKFRPVTSYRIDKFKSRLNRKLDYCRSSERNPNDAFKEIFQGLSQEFENVFTKKEVDVNCKLSLNDWATSGIYKSRRKLYDLYEQRIYS